MFHHLLVPIDGSDVSLDALDHAIDYACLEGASLDLVHVIDKRIVAAGPRALPSEAQTSLLEKLHEHGEHLLNDSSARAKARGVQTRIHLLQGNIAEEVDRVSGRLGCDLIIMGTHGRRGWAPMILGSTAEAVLQRCACSVLLVAYLAR